MLWIYTKEEEICKRRGEKELAFYYLSFNSFSSLQLLLHASNL